MSVWTTLTNFGDSFIMVPVAATVWLLLLAERNWRAAAWWTLLFGCGGLLIAGTKIAFIGWGIGIRALNFTGLSGHTTFSTAIYPVVAYLTLQSLPRHWRLGGAALGMLLAVAVGISRLKLAAHSTPEVLFGLAIGLAVSTSFIRGFKPSSHTPRLSMAAGVCTALLCLFLHGSNAPTQDLITRIALYLAGHDTPYTRERLWGLHLQPAPDALD